MNFISKTNQKGTLESGDVFLIPLDEDRYSIGMFHKYIEKPLYSAICSFYPSVVLNENEILEPMLAKPISIKLATPHGLETKKWRVVANCKPKLDAKALPDYSYRKTLFKRKKPVMEKVYGDGNIRKFLKAYHGLALWNSMHDPEYFDKMLLDIRMKPNNLLLE